MDELLDWDLKPPSAAQLAFASVLAKRHRIQVPDQAKLSRLAMHEFIEAYSRRKPTTYPAGEISIEEAK